MSTSKGSVNGLAPAKASRPRSMFGRSKDRAAAGAHLPIDTARVLESFDGAALVVDGRLTAISANAAALPLIEALEIGDTAGALPALLRDILAAPRAIARRLDIPRRDDPGAGPRTFDLTVLPCQAGERFGESLLVLGVETTFERNLTKALMTSRDLFRDLVRLSSDLAWETSPSGVFVYVSPAGLAGFGAKALNGRAAASLLVGKTAGAPYNPFVADVPLEEAGVVVRGADGRECELVVSATPVVDKDGRRLGTRGVARDVTALRARERELEARARRDRLVASVVDAMRRELDPSVVLDTAARAIAAATGAMASVLIGRNGSGSPAPSLLAVTPATAEPLLSGDRLEEFLATFPLETMGEEVVARHWRDLLVLAVRTSHQEAPNGLALALSAASYVPFSSDAIPLLTHVAPHLGIAFAAAEQTWALERMSQTDPLTGLANRRAFEAHVAQSIIQCRRDGTTGSLLYIDVDDFKPINDRLGHAAGDAYLAALGQFLSGTSRRYDVAARLGGDEFAIWLQGADANGALIKAQKVLDAQGEISAGTGVPWAVSLSIGGACLGDLEEPTIAALMAEADHCLYEAKRAGKSQVRVRTRAEAD